MFSLAALAALFAIKTGSQAQEINISASSSGYDLFVDVNALNLVNLDTAVTIAVDVRWTDCGDDKCLMVHVPLPRLKEYVAYLATAAAADLLAAN